MSELLCLQGFRQVYTEIDISQYTGILLPYILEVTHLRTVQGQYLGYSSIHHKVTLRVKYCTSQDCQSYRERTLHPQSSIQELDILVSGYIAYSMAGYMIHMNES